MPGIKRLKKEIKTIANELIAECETYRHFHPDIPAEKINSIENGVKSELKEIIYKVNHFKYNRDKKASEYFNEIYDKVKNGLIQKLDQLGSIG